MLMLLKKVEDNVYSEYSSCVHGGIFNFFRSFIQVFVASPYQSIKLDGLTKSSFQEPKCIMNYNQLPYRRNKTLGGKVDSRYNE